MYLQQEVGWEMLDRILTIETLDAPIRPPLKSLASKYHRISAPSSQRAP